MNRLITTVVVGLAGFQGISQAVVTRPKLVVGIIVDQLRTDYLETLQDKFGNGGFRLLMEKGAFIKDLDFGIPNLDETNATAIIQTGTYPRLNGVSGEIVFSPTEKKLVSLFYDPSYIGNFTNETFSPEALRVTTITDEITVANNGGSTIHSIAPDAEEAIILAGHTGNSAFWINDNTGKWSSTTYYKSQPAILQDKNYNRPLTNRLDTMKWTPMAGPNFYPDVSSKAISEGFKYTFSRSDRNVYSFYKSSPFVNTDITEAAADYIRSLKPGNNKDITDVLNIAYTLAPYPEIKKGDGKYEMEDAYLRLDRDLSRLFSELDRSVGMENVLVYVASTGYFEEPELQRSLYRLPSGNFSVKRALSLLNAFLSAKYGNGGYVKEYTAGHIFLDHSLIESKNIPLSQLAEEARDFLVKMSGVADAFTLADLQSPAVPRLQGHRLGNDPKFSGDLILEFNPGWQVTDDYHFPAVTQHSKTSAYPAPAFIMGSEISPQVISETVDATVIAPTVAKNLHIRSPNGAVSKALHLK